MLNKKPTNIAVKLYELFRQTNRFKEIKKIINDSHHIFQEAFDDYPEVGSDDEVSTLESIDFETIERRGSGGEERISYMYENPKIRIWVSIEFESATESEPRGNNIIESKGRIVLRNSEEVFAFKTDENGRNEFTHR